MAWREAPDAYGMRLDAGVYHGFNILVHATSAVVVWVILRRVLGFMRLGRSLALPAGVGAMVFALHPVQVETVGWVSGGKDLLMGLFVLLALWQYLVYAQRDAEGRTREARGNYALATGALVLGLLSKPTAVVTPLLALVLDVAVAGRPVRRAAVALAPWAGLASGAAVVARIVQPTAYVDGGPLWARPLIALDALAFYLWKLVVPYPLAIDYGRTPAHVLGSAWGYVTWVVPVGVAALIVWRWKRAGAAAAALAAGGLWFAIGVLPVLGLTTFLFQSFSTTADHYLYLSMGGVGLAAAALVARGGETRGVAVACAVALVALGARSAAQSLHWRDSVALFTQAVRVNPESHRMRSNLGDACELEADAAAARRRPEEAQRWRQRAQEHYRTALKADPANFQMRNGLVLSLGKDGRVREAVAELEEAWRWRDAVAPEQRGALNDVPRQIGLVAINLGDYAKAARWLGEAWRIDPSNKEVRAKLEEAQRKAGGLE